MATKLQKKTQANLNDKRGNYKYSPLDRQAATKRNEQNLLLP